MGSHSKALQTASELGTSRSALTVKCPPKQPIAAELNVGAVAALTVLVVGAALERCGSDRLSWGAAPLTDLLTTAMDRPGQGRTESPQEQGGCDDLDGRGRPSSFS